MALRYLDRSRPLVRSPATGWQYEFADKSTQMVDAQDADALLRTRHFFRG